MRRVVRRAAEEEEEPEDDEETQAAAEDDGDGDEYEEDEDSVVRPGWDGYRTTKAKSGFGADFLKFDDSGEAMLLRFLQAAPFASYRQHWVDRQSGKRSWVCIEENCPLCDAGDTPSFRIAFNILLLSDGKPQNKVWEVGPRLAEQLEAKAKDKRTGPLDRSDMYWAVSRTGKKSKTSYSVDPVKARDLKEDWEIEPLDAKAIKHYQGKMYDHKVIKVPALKQLKEIAAEMLDEEFDDEDDDE
ncbi:MAG TPA: hypothetical protein VFI41_04720 [Gemmatimonadales bacterium]|nr:hypothetical protein [Gemmatimonadales bacterium]